jgi:hypothetical protein
MPILKHSTRGWKSACDCLFVAFYNASLMSGRQVKSRHTGTQKKHNLALDFVRQKGNNSVEYFGIGKPGYYIKIINLNCDSKPK